MHRFFLTMQPPANLLQAGETVELPDRLAHQVRSVLRLAVGEQLVLLDNSGDELLCTVVRSERTGVEVKVLERRSGLHESSVRIVLCQGLLKSARFEWILEKGTELGVSMFVPVLCRRSTAGLEETGSSKIQRWQRILQEATEQCGRARIPELLPTRQLMQAFHDIPDRALAFIPWEEERELGLRAALQEALYGLSKHETAQQLTVVLFIGPEGGFLAEEVELARKYGVRAVTLGPRIMRAETAAIAAVANVMYELER